VCQIKAIDFSKLNKSAREELDEKMRLEAIYERELSQIYNRLLRDFRISVVATGQAFDARNYRPEFEASLLKHYRRTQAFFKGRILDSVEGKIIRLKQNEEEDQDLEALILAALLAWRTGSATRQSLFITNTNQHQMQNAITRARQQVTSLSLPVDNRTLAAEANALLSRDFKARIKRISVTETQSAAEAARNIEATSIAGKVPFPLQRVEGVEPAVPPRIVTKSWRDIGDDKVRDSHVLVDGTTIPEDAVFTVGPTRSKLRFPGDMLLGAAVEETINCRCFADYQLIRR